MRSFWAPWRPHQWRTWPRWFQILWPVELATILTLTCILVARL
jgi:hypothetical protein